MSDEWIYTILCKECDEPLGFEFLTSDSIFRIHPCDNCFDYFKVKDEIPEKRPDFGKLNIGDKLIIEIMPNDSKGSKVIEYFGYFQGISEANMFEISINTYSFIGDCISVSRVKKITRINIEKQTFEEI